MNFWEMLSPIVKLNMIKTLFFLFFIFLFLFLYILGLHIGWMWRLPLLWHMDLPPWFLLSSGVGTICKLKKALYGLKQLPWACSTDSVMPCDIMDILSRADHMVFS